MLLNRLQEAAWKFRTPTVRPDPKGQGKIEISWGKNERSVEMLVSCWRGQKTANRRVVVTINTNGDE